LKRTLTRKGFDMKKTLDARDIPKHYVPLTKYGGTRLTRGGKRVENWEYRWLRDRWYFGQLPGIKLLRSPTDDKGNVYVDPTVVEAALAEVRASRANDATADSRVMRAVSEVGSQTTPILCDSSLLTAVHAVAESVAALVAGQASLLAEIRRVADAAEQIATQPKEPAGSWRDMNGEVMN
jgi:hypothetical protein